MNHETYYQKAIQETNHGVYDPRWIEAWMRINDNIIHDYSGCLDHLSKQAFEKEVIFSMECIRQAGFKQSENLALSMGL